MLLTLDGFFFNETNAAQNPAGPPEQTKTGSNIASASIFGSAGVTTVVGRAPAGSASPLVAGLPVVVFADYSCYCPLLGIFIPPEFTNFASKTSSGSGN